MYWKLSVFLVDYKHQHPFLSTGSSITAIANAAGRRRALNYKGRRKNCGISSSYCFFILCTSLYISHVYLVYKSKYNKTKTSTKHCFSNNGESSYKNYTPKKYIGLEKCVEKSLSLVSWFGAVVFIFILVGVLYYLFSKQLVQII